TNNDQPVRYARRGTRPTHCACQNMTTMAVAMNSPYPSQRWRAKGIIWKCRSSLQPIRKRVQIIQVQPRQRPVRTSAFAGWPTQLFHAEIALGRLQNRFLFLVHEEFAVLVANLHHANRLVRTIVETGFATNARDRVDHHLPTEGVAMDGAGRA